MTNLDPRLLDLLARRNLSADDVLFCGEVGSTVHGLGVGDQDDLDLTVIRMEPWQELVTGNPRHQSIMLRTQPEGARSGPGDLDVNVYTLRKFGALAIKANPSILNVFFLPLEKTVNLFGDFRVLQDLHSCVASREAGGRYLGYMNAQLERWQGTRGQKNVNRPELVDAYGFDTKYAAHIVRLGLQGAEYLSTGQITIPMAPGVASEIVGLRTGELTEEEALEWAQCVEADLRLALTASELPAHPDTKGAQKIIANWYRLWQNGWIDKREKT